MINLSKPMVGQFTDALMHLLSLIIIKLQKLRHRKAFGKYWFIYAGKKDYPFALSVQLMGMQNNSFNLSYPSMQLFMAALSVLPCHWVWYPEAKWEPLQAFYGDWVNKLGNYWENALIYLIEYADYVCLQFEAFHFVQLVCLVLLSTT